MSADCVCRFRNSYMAVTDLDILSNIPNRKCNWIFYQGYKEPDIRLQIMLH